MYIYPDSPSVKNLYSKYMHTIYFMVKNILVFSVLLATLPLLKFEFQVLRALRDRQKAVNLHGINNKTLLI